MFSGKLINRDRIAKIDKERLPVHIAIFMDGNGRWATKRGLPRSAGHREGSETLRKIVKCCGEIGIKYLTVYAFSTENWNRPKDEVDALMDLLLEYLKNAEKEIGGKNVRISVIGSKDRLSDEIISEIDRVAKNTAGNNGLNFIIALNYGGRSEIVDAVKSIAREVAERRLAIDDINEQIVSDHLYTSDIPDPDLVIRPSGEQRISNFLLWQSSYAEFWYSDILWPDFREHHLLKAIADYQGRNRRFGGV